MKVTRIEIKDFNQFKSLDIDLTYPKGHAKEGQPLDKVCFIGQSGTGKTTLLKILGGHTYRLRDFEKFYNLNKTKNSIYVSNILNDLKYRVTLGYDESTQEARYYWQDYSIRGRKSTFDRAKTYKASVILEIPTHIINFPADLKYENIAQKENYKITDKKVIDLAHESLGDIWNIILDEIKIYQEKSLIFRQEISRVAESFNADIKEIQKVVRKFENWKKKNASPIEVIAEKCIDFLLKPLNLRVKRESDIQSKEEIGFIKIEDFDGNEIPHGLLSTGTKQILYSALPLYLLKPRNTIILFDEPERSLYPDMQRMIIDFYSSLTQDSQFFYATHSPIIASSFEPWEIIELKLDENGYVYQDLYYKGERHVDNYHIYPQYLDYDTMLKNVFDLKETRPQIGIDKIGDVLMYKNHLFKLKKEGKTNTKEFKDLFDKYKRLAEQVAWDFNVLEDEKN